MKSHSFAATKHIDFFVNSIYYKKNSLNVKVVHKLHVETPYCKYILYEFLQVSFTLLEIYNEEVFDLLSKRSKGSKGPSLRVYDSKGEKNE